jgi:hypothetical protein
VYSTINTLSAPAEKATGVIRALADAR